AGHPGPDPRAALQPGDVPSAVRALLLRDRAPAGRPHSLRERPAGPATPGRRPQLGEHAAGLAPAVRVRVPDDRGGARQRAIADGAAARGADRGPVRGVEQPQRLTRPEREARDQPPASTLASYRWRSAPSPRSQSLNARKPSSKE